MSETIAGLIQRLKQSKDTETCGNVMLELMDSGPAAIPELIRLLSDEAHAWAAARILGEFGAAARGAVPGLVRLLAGLDPGDRMHAASALGAIGPDAKLAVPSILDVWRDPHEASFVREAAAIAVKKIDPQAAAREGVV
jgi:HEAT repeat protein